MTTTQSTARARYSATDLYAEVAVEFATREQAEAFATALPKSFGRRVFTMTYSVQSEQYAPAWAVRDSDGYFLTYQVRITANLGANLANGGANETGAKRIRRFVQAVRAAGVGMERRHCSNDLSDELTAELIGA